MLLAAALAWLNAAIIAFDGAFVASTRQAIAVSLIVATLYALLGFLQFKMQQHLFRLWAASEPCAHPSLFSLTVYNGLLSGGVVLVMLLSLSAVISRLREGFAIFG